MTMRYALLLTLALIILPQLNSQSYGNLSYSAVWSVKYVQHLPRLNSKLGSASKDFNIETSNPGNDYTSSVVVFPVLMVCLMFASMSLWVCCWHGCKPAINVDGNIKQQIKQNSLVKRRQCYGYFFFVLFLVCCQGLMFVITYAQDATNTSTSAVEYLHNVAINLQLGGERLDQSGNSTFASIQRSVPVCPGASTILDYQPDYQASMDAYLKLINPVPHAALDFQDFLELWGEQKMTQSILIIYIISIVMTVPMLISLVLKAGNLLYFTVIVGYQMLVGMLISSCLFSIGLVSE
jgi:hypothetical protein